MATLSALNVRFHHVISFFRETQYSKVATEGQ